MRRRAQRESHPLVRDTDRDGVADVGTVFMSGCVAIDADGALLVADDVGNSIWRVSNGAPTTAATRTDGSAPQPTLRR